MHTFQNNYGGSFSTPTYYHGDVIQNLLRYLKYRDIIINGKILTVIEVYPSTLQIEVIEDRQIKRYYLNSTNDKIQLTINSEMFIIDYIINQKKK